ncbi:MarR family winged helix-turn-helix transcriptional regulator [Paenibacillus sp. D51F]
MPDPVFNDKEESGQLDQSVGFLMGVAYRRISLLLQQRLKPWEITSEQWSMLFRVCEREGLIQKELADWSAKDKPTTTRILDNLEAKGLIERRPDDRDRRSLRIHASEAGRRLIDETVSVEAEAVAGITAGMRAEEQEMLRRLIRQLIRNANSQLEVTS